MSKSVHRASGALQLFFFFFFFATVNNEKKHLDLFLSESLAITLEFFFTKLLFIELVFCL